MHSKAVLVLAAITFTVATIGINVVANFVSPAFDIANLWPAKVSFRTGGFITAFLALVVMPWKIYSTPVIINYFLGTLGAFLGPLYGILMVDYYITRKQVVITDDLYRPEPGGAYYYDKGVNPNAIGAFVPSAAITAVIALAPAFKTEAPFSWVIGAVLGSVSYDAITRVRGSGAPGPGRRRSPPVNPRRSHASAPRRGAPLASRDPVATARLTTRAPQRSRGPLARAPGRARVARSS